MSNDRESSYRQLTFKMEENIGSVVLEHLGYKFNIHILNVDFLLNRGVTLAVDMMVRP